MKVMGAALGQGARWKPAGRRKTMQFPSPTATGVAPWSTTPNVVTIARTVGSVTVGVGAITAYSLVLLVVAYGIYWLGDMLDGMLARQLGQETKLGAVLDIICDRACSAICGSCILMLLPQA